jgi:hypothetical protein
MCPPLARRINRFTLAVRYPGFRSDPLTPLKISKANLIRRTSETCRFNPSENSAVYRGSGKDSITVSKTCQGNCYYLR